MPDRDDDLVPLLTPQPTGQLGYRQGVVLTWDSATAENTIRVGGSVLTNVPILNTNEAILLGPGSVVFLLTAGASWFILGRVTIPGTPDAASALSMVRIASASVISVQATSSTAFTDLATVGPVVDVTVGASGRLLVMTTCAFDYNGLNSQGGGYMSYDLAGPVNRSASIFKSVVSMHSDFNSNWVHGSRCTAVNLETDLPPGGYTITAKYRVINGSNPMQFFDRNIVAIPL